MNSKVILNWDNAQQTILRIDFARGWQWQDLFHVLEDANQLLDASPHPVSIIANPLSNFVHMPNGIIANIPRLVGMKHDKMNLAVIVGNNHLVKLAVDLLVRLLPQDRNLIHYTTSLDDARTIVEQEQSRLRDPQL